MTLPLIEILVAQIGDDDPELHKEVFRLWSAATDVSEAALDHGMRSSVTSGALARLHELLTPEHPVPNRCPSCGNQRIIAETHPGRFRAYCEACGWSRHVSR